MRTGIRKSVWAAVAALVLIVAGAWFYVNDYYHAEESALAALAPVEGVSVIQESDRVVFQPEMPKAGLIFYPGGKVEFTAYAPLMQTLAKEGVLCVLLKMPANLAVLDMDAAEGIPEQFPETGSWYLAGHSLGGSMAASYIAGAEGYDGLILLAAYSTEDLTEQPVKVLSLYGSEDGVLDLEKYRSYRPNLPEDTREMVIPGGNHAQFGSYGPQEGDGTAAISPEEQRNVTAEEILGFLGE